jgi:ribose transport system permease protein
MTARLSGVDVQSLVFRGVVLAVAVIGSIAVDGFADVDNLRALLSSIAIVGIVALGLVFVTISGNLFILSIGATMAVSSVIFAALVGDLGIVPALVATIGAGAVIGLVQGVIVGRFSGDPIITTIAVGSVILGFGQVFAGGDTIRAGRDVSVLRSDVLDVIPIEGLVFIVMAVVAYVLLTWSRFGAFVRLTGENREAARIAGVPVVGCTIVCYAIAAAAAALAAAFLSARAGQGRLDVGIGMDFDAIAVLLVAGVAVTGGRGSVVNVALGALFIGMVANILAVLGEDYATQLFARGIIVLLALIAAGVAGRLRKDQS